MYLELALGGHHGAGAGSSSALAISTLAVRCWNSPGSAPGARGGLRGQQLADALDCVLELRMARVRVRHLRVGRVRSSRSAEAASARGRRSPRPGASRCARVRFAFQLARVAGHLAQPISSASVFGLRAARRRRGKRRPRPPARRDAHRRHARRLPILLDARSFKPWRPDSGELVAEHSRELRLVRHRRQQAGVDVDAAVGSAKALGRGRAARAPAPAAR